jgi:hypothetical protein
MTKVDYGKRVNIGKASMYFGGICLSIAVLPAAQAAAQEDVQARSVAERARPEFTAQPIRAGGLDITPTIDVAAEYNDNIFFESLDPTGGFITSVELGLMGRDVRPDRAVTLRVLAGYDAYLDHSNENRLNLLASADARFGLGTRTRYHFGAEVNRADERRRDIASLSDSPDPITYTSLRANAGVAQDFGRVSASLDANARSVIYNGSIAIADQTIDLGFRDFEVYGAKARISYSSGGSQRVYVQVSADDRNYSRLAPDPDIPANFSLDRSSRGVRIEAGFSHQISELLFFDLRGGYLNQEFADPALPTVKGIAFEGSLLWNVTPLTSMELTGVRQVDETVDPNLSGLIRTEVSGRIDHELLRNLILTLDGQFAHLSQVGNPAKFDEWEAGFSAQYLVNRKWTVTLDADHFERSSSFSIKQNRIVAGLQFSF